MSNPPKKTVCSVKLSTLAQSVLKLDGGPFSLKHYPMFEAIYDGHYKKISLKCGRQVAKSTTLAALFVAETVSLPHYKVLYVSPSSEQTNKFSNTRVGKMMAYSPIIRSGYTQRNARERVLFRAMSNGSEMTFTYASDDPDRARGNTADRVAYDEIQDIIYPAVVPVINECMANSDYKYEIYAGTPKSMENGIEYLWQTSTQTEWCIPCSGCGKYTAVVSTDCFGKHGIECLACRKPLNTREGVWVDMNPGAEVKGFHVSQPILPRNLPASMPNDSASQELAQSRWQDILDKQDTYPAAKFNNEVLGISDAVGRRLVSKEELEALCTGPPITRTPDRMELGKMPIRVAGIDWSGGGTKSLSRTVVWVAGWISETQKLRCLYYKILPGRNPVEEIEDIIKVIEAYSVSCVVGDAGEGALANAEIRKAFGNRLSVQAQYCAAKTPIKWNNSDRYMVDRTSAIDNYMMQLKRGVIELPPLEEAREAISDILNEYEEVTATGRKIWQHNPQMPDDCLHAGLFAWLAWKIATGNLQMYM